MTLLVIGFILNSPVRNIELDFTIFVVPFQLKIFYDSMILWYMIKQS